MKYESQKTAKGNIGVSFASQAAADAHASEMDVYGNISCIIGGINHDYYR